MDEARYAHVKKIVSKDFMLSPVLARELIEETERLKNLEGLFANVLGVRVDDLISEGLPRIPAMEAEIERLIVELEKKSE